MRSQQSQQETATAPPQGESGEPPIEARALPLHTSIDKESEDKLINGDFVDMKDISPKSTRGNNSNTQSRSGKSQTIIGWSRGYLRLMSQLVKAGKADTQDLLIHMDTVLSLAEDRHMWESYDHDFRSQQRKARYSYANTRVELFAKAVTRQQQPFRSMSSSRGFPKKPYAQGRQTETLQPGMCYNFHLKDNYCEDPNCTFSHTCRCGGTHPQYRCFNNRPRQDRERKESQPPKKTT